MDEIIRIYTDGACSGNPGKGGYGIIMKYKDNEKEFSGGYKHTTNNRMELLACIIALEKLKKDNLNIEIYNDSKYVIDSVEKGWVFNWLSKENFSNKKNKDLWLKFIELYKKHKIKFIWVKGHNGHKENERCDFLSTTQTKKDILELKDDENYDKENIN